MDELEIYNSEGGMVFPTERTGGRRPEIDTFNKDDIHFATRRENRGPVYYLRFRAKENVSARKNIFYARFVPNDANSDTGIQSVRDLIDSLRKTAKQEWGYILDNPGNGLFQGRQLGDITNTDETFSILEGLLDRNKSSSVSAQSTRMAIEVACSVERELGKSVAISGKQELMSDWDLMIDTGATSGIEPARGTRADWKAEQERLQKRNAKDEIDKIRTSVNKLRNEHGYTAQEIKNQIPSLQQSQPRAHTTTQDSMSSPRGRKSKLAGVNFRRILPLIAVVLVVLALLIIAYSGLLPSIGLSDRLPGSFFGPTTYALTGSITDTTGDPIEDIEIELTLRGESFDGETVNETLIINEGSYEFDRVPPGEEYVITATAAGYRDNSTSFIIDKGRAESTIPEDERQLDIQLEPDLTVEAVDEDGGQIRSFELSITADGETFEARAENGRYQLDELSGFPESPGIVELIIDADGYEQESVTVEITDNTYDSDEIQETPDELPIRIVLTEEAVTD